MPAPTNTSLTDQVITVCFAPGQDADWFAASEKVHDLLQANGTPSRRYRVRHRRLIGWLTASSATTCSTPPAASARSPSPPAAARAAST
ncbi:hypothetical protein AB0B18_28750 [Micromonospora chalcea]